MKRSIVFLFISTLIILSACSNDSQGSTEVVIGYFPNLTHAPAMVAKEKRMYEKQLGDDVNVAYQTFPDGSDFMTALATGEIQGGLVGPGPAMNSFISGVDVNMIAAASKGGKVVLSRKESGVKSAEDIQSETFISPRVGCTCDVQFEAYMNDIGITSDRIGGTMKHVTGEPAQYAAMFEKGDVDVAVAAEPWASVLESEGANVVIDSDEMAFGESLPVSVFVTTPDFAESNQELVQKLVKAHKESIHFINENPAESIDIVINDIDEITGEKLDRNIIENAWERTDFIYEFDEDIIQKFGDTSYDLQFLKEKPDFSGFVDKSFIES